MGGLNVCVAPDNPPGFQVNDAAPLAVNTVEDPLQIVASLTANVGEAFTVTVFEILEVQVPLAPMMV